MIVISDTTPIITLMKIEQLNLLEKLYQSVQIPESVYLELTSSKKFAREAEQIRLANYINVLPVNDRKSVDLLRRATGLDAGESEAIILSDENKADLLLIDEAKGRQVARQMGIAITGTIGILSTALDEGYLSSDDVRNCILGLKSSGIYLSDKLLEQLRKKIL